MLRKTKYYLLISVFALLLYGCGDTLQDPFALSPDSPGTMTIRLHDTDLSRSQDSDNSEIIIDRLVIGFYPSDLLSGAGEDDKALMWKEFTGLNDSGTSTVTFALNDNMVKTLFSSSNTCRFFVVANLPEDCSIPEYASIAEMKSAVITATFDEEPVQPSFVMSGEGTVTYVSSSLEAGKASGTAELWRTSAKIMLNVGIVDNVAVPEGAITEKWIPVADSMKVWLNNGVKKAVVVPETGDMDWPWAPSEEDADEAYWSGKLSNLKSLRKFESSGTGDYPYSVDVPLYTYPNSWSDIPSETHKTFLTLMVPWHKESEPEDTVRYFYRVPVTPADIFNIESNHLYTINLKVGILGTLTPEEIVTIDNASYKIVKWRDETVEVDIADTRYLVVNPNVYVFNNQEVMSIPFYTSHKAVISDITMTYERFNYPNDDSGYKVTIPVSKKVIDDTNKDSAVPMCWYEVVRDEVSGMQTLQITHPLVMWNPCEKNQQGTVNLVQLTRAGTLDELPEKVEKINLYRQTLPKEAAFSPYRFTLTVRHEDEPSFNRSVTITQYPGMYIDTDWNPGGRYAWETATGTLYTADAFFEGYETSDGVVNRGYRSNYGWVFINSTSRIIDGVRYWKFDQSLLPPIASNERGSTLVNLNMYLVNITQLEATASEYVIGDPRMKVINNDLSGETVTSASTADGAWSVEALALYDGPERRLRYYHPTNESKAAENMVAPRFRVASVFGANSTVGSKEVCRRRCATYQEQGFPAGRWRLPTYGELKYILSLSARDYIPVLFNIGMVYMTAQGPVKVNGNGLTYMPEGTKGYVRAVYDEWYWEKETDYVLNKDGDAYYYTLGDMPLKVTGN